jgi:hypothetical protein
MANLGYALVVVAEKLRLDRQSQQAELALNDQDLICFWREF